MGRIYAVREDNGVRKLVAIRCDWCGAEIAPGPDIAASGWMEAGFDHGLGTEKFRQIYCPACWAERERR